MWISISGLSYTTHTQDVFQKKQRKTLWSIENLTMEQRGFVLLAGRNGCGKSTLLRCLLGLIHPTTGTYYWGPSEHIGYVPEFPIIPPQLALGSWLQAVCGALPGGPLPDPTFEPLGTLGAQLMPLLQVPAHRLSKGQQQKAHLWVALCRCPSTLVLDEPFSGLDPWARAELATLLAQWALAGKGILMAGHEMPSSLEPQCSHTWLVEEEQVQVKHGCGLPSGLSIVKGTEYGVSPNS